MNVPKNCKHQPSFFVTPRRSHLFCCNFSRNFHRFESCLVLRRYNERNVSSSIIIFFRKLSLSRSSVCKFSSKNIRQLRHISLVKYRGTNLEKSFYKPLSFYMSLRKVFKVPLTLRHSQCVLFEIRRSLQFLVVSLDSSHQKHSPFRS